MAKLIQAEKGVKRVNRKVLSFVLLLSLVSVLFGPIIIVKGEKKDALSFYKVHVPGYGPFTKYNSWLTDEGTLKIHSTAPCNIVDDNYVINIGGSIIDDDGDGIWEFNGEGEIFVLGEDFTYEGYHVSKLEYTWFYGWRRTKWQFTLYGIYDFTLSGIEGTIEFCQRALTYYSVYNEVIESRTYVNGHGTGALAGVTVEAGEAPTIYTEQTGAQWATQEGIIWGWPQTE